METNFNFDLYFYGNFYASFIEFRPDVIEASSMTTAALLSLTLLPLDTILEMAVAFAENRTELLNLGSLRQNHTLKNEIRKFELKNTNYL